MKIFFSGDAFGYNHGPERLLPEMKPNLMMTYFDFRPGRSAQKGIIKRFKRHVKRRRK